MKDLITNYWNKARNSQKAEENSQGHSQVPECKEAGEDPLEEKRKEDGGRGRRRSA